MELIIWSFIFIISLYALIKAADWLTAGIQKIAGGSGAGIIAASVCVVLPELAAALAAVTQGLPELAVAIVIGSSIANILLVTGVGAISAKSIQIKKEHVDQDLPLFVASIAFFYFIAQDGSINFLEGMLALVVFFVYAVYVFSSNRRPMLTPRDIITPESIGGAMMKLVEVIPTRLEKGFEHIKTSGKHSLSKTAVLLVGGAIILVIAANFTIESLVAISKDKEMLIPATVTAMIVLAAAAVLPEIFAGLAVARKKRYEIIMGNVFSFVTINLLLVTGAAALFMALPVKNEVMEIGLPFLVGSAAILTVSSISHSINFGEGIMYLFLYLLFFVKLFGLF